MKARGAQVIVITDNAKLAAGIDSDPLIIPNNGPLTALTAVLPLQVSFCVFNHYVPSIAKYLIFLIVDRV